MTRPASRNGRFHKTTAGREASRRPRSKNDCAVRALAVATGVSFDEAYDWCAERGRAPHKGFSLDKVLRRMAETTETVFGHAPEYLSFPAVKGEKRMNEGTFPHVHPEGRYVLREAGHVLACVDGVVHDDVWTPERCVYSAIRLSPVSERDADEGYPVTVDGWTYRFYDMDGATIVAARSPIDAVELYCRHVRAHETTDPDGWKPWTMQELTVLQATSDFTFTETDTGRTTSLASQLRTLLAEQSLLANPAVHDGKPFLFATKP